MTRETDRSTAALLSRNVRIFPDSFVLGKPATTVFEGDWVAVPLEDFDAARAALGAVPVAEGLDAAWAAAEAALPEGWSLSGLTGYKDTETDLMRWEAAASGVGVPCSCGHNWHRESAFEEAVRDTPAAALLALAAKFRERADR